MLNRKDRWNLALAIALFITLLFACIGWPILQIQLRLLRNTAIAERLINSLHERFPGTEFRGSASYENEVVYITAIKGVRPETAPDIEHWLRRFKSQQNIQPKIWLRLDKDSGEEKDVIKI